MNRALPDALQPCAVPSDKSGRDPAMPRLLPALLLVTSVMATTADAQSLADIARKERERRKDIAKPAKVYTNRDLAEVQPMASVPAMAAPGDAGASAAGPAPAGAIPGTVDEGVRPDGPTEPSDEEKRAAEESQWRARMAQARDKLERSKMFAEALQTRANSLWADFTARDDPAQRSVIETDRQKTLAELDRVKGEIETETKAIADLEEEARRAGVPPGWLR
jgi:hypothetical protein